jgi:hypothetical protein
VHISVQQTFLNHRNAARHDTFYQAAICEIFQSAFSVPPPILLGGFTRKQVSLRREGATEHAVCMEKWIAPHFSSVSSTAPPLLDVSNIRQTYLISHNSFFNS